MLPRRLGAWASVGIPRRINASTIFDYMDGAGEMYLAYLFDHLDVYDFAASDGSAILVELYWMRSSDDAFGLLSGDWGGEAIDLDGASTAETSDASSPAAPPHRALYGAGLLRIWADTLFVRILASHETPASREQVLEAGRLLVAGRRRPSPPRLLQALPLTAATNWRIRADRTVFLRSHLVLNSAYFLSAENILDLDHDTDAVFASYERRGATSPPERMRLLVVRYGDAGAARRAMAQFTGAYLPESILPAGADLKAAPLVARIEDGFVACHQAERSVAIVFGSPDERTALDIVGHSVKNMARLEQPDAR